MNSDSKCIGGPDVSQSKICKEYNDKCFTHIGGFEVSRGCLSDRGSHFEETCRKDEEKCSICSPTDDKCCNDKPIASETCVECDSTKDEKCQNQPESYTGKICSTISSTDKEGCFLNTV